MELSAKWSNKMTEQLEDRRKRRTRTRLREGLLALILEKPYDEITVQDILDRADVSRSAFYAHFRDKDELLLMGMPNDILSYGLDTSETFLPSVAGIFAHMKEGQAWFQAMQGNAAMMLVSQKSRQRMVENWVTHIEQWRMAGHPMPFPATAVAHYLTGALMSLLIWWTNNGMKESPEEMNEMFQYLAGKGVPGETVDMS
jgi:AcrR family transcriptional regulator